MMDMKRNSWLRLTLAMIISPLVPVLALSAIYWIGTGDPAWIWLFATFGYLFFLVIGVPVAGVLVNAKTVSSCAVGGGFTAVAPVLLLSTLSVLSGNKIFTLEMIASLGLLFMIGCVGGFLFWCIAFAPLRRRSSSR
jgi:hypothetical protein